MTTEKPAESVAEGGQNRRSLARYAILIAALAFMALLAYGLASGGDDRVEAGMAPDFTLTDFEGNTYRLSDLSGQVVVVNFWATWCVSCKDEAVDLEMTWRDYKDQGVLFLGVDYLDQEPLNLEYIERYDITYPNGPDIQGRIYNTYGVQGLPETFVINGKGEVTRAFVGAVTQAQLSAAIDEALASG